MVTIKSPDEIKKMRVAGQAVAQIIAEMAAITAPGVKTIELDRLAEKRCKELGVVPAFKGYRGFPGCVCISVNDEVVHGIPSAKKTLKSGDLVGIDFGVIADGWYGDSARTVIVGGKTTSKAEELVKNTEKALHLGIQECRPGNHLYDIGFAIQNYVEGFGYGVVKEFVGHGIGRSLHEDPQVPNYGLKGKGLTLKVGMVLAIEPMINAGKPEVAILDDGWTAVTRDGSLSAHFEHTVAILEHGPEILTLV